MKKSISLLFAHLVFLLGCEQKEANIQFNLIPVKSGEYWGYIDHEGKFKINPQFKNAFAFNEGLALVEGSDGKMGFVNEDGKYIVSPTYKNAAAFSEGLALVVKENGQLEYINKQGETKFTLGTEIQAANSFSEDLAIVFSENSFGFINKEGKVEIPIKFNYGSNFKEGLAIVGLVDSANNNNTRFGFIDKKGNVVVNYQFNSAESFSDGLALVYNGKQYGFIDKQGKFVINPQFDNATSFHNGLAIIKQGELSGFIDKTGKIIINPQFKNADFFYGNNIAAATSTENKFGFIDKDGKFIINPQFDEATRFYGNVSVVKMASKYGLIDEKGKIIVNPQFDYVRTIKDYDTRINSDYFDMPAVLSYFMQNSKNNAFGGFQPATTTFKSIKSIYPNLNENNFYSFTDFTGPENKYVKLSKFIFTFNPDLFTYKPAYSTQQVYDPVVGGYTTQQVYSGTQTALNEGAAISSVSFYYNLYGKAKYKRDDILKELKDKIKFQLKMIEENDQNNAKRNIYQLKSNDYSITLQPSLLADYDIDIYCGSQAIISVNTGAMVTDSTSAPH